MAGRATAVALRLDLRLVSGSTTGYSMPMQSSPSPTRETWLKLIGYAYALFDDAAAKGFGDPPFSLGGGTVLMLRFEHRLSKDIDLFGYDAQWLSVFSPRLNERAAALADRYVEQANTVKIVTPSGDIDFIIAADVAVPVTRHTENIAGRLIEVDPIAEILAKKLFYRAATLKTRDIYDLSAAIDLAPEDAEKAVRAASAKREILVRRLDQLSATTSQDLGSEIVAYNGILQHSRGMMEKVRSFVLAQRDEPDATKTSVPPRPGEKRKLDR